MTYGAAPQDWQRFADLGLTPDLLPVVSDPGIPLSPHSKLREANRGKVPSFVLGDGTLAGIPGWSRDRAAPADLSKWSKDTRLGICVQTREVRAIDVDIGDPAISADVRETVEMTLGHLPCRSRPNSGKLLLAFRLPGTYLKRILETPHGRIEFLANGQHFVAVGTHPSGVRYEWDDYAIPSLTADEFEAVWSALEAQFGEPQRRREVAEVGGRDDSVVGLTDTEIREVLEALDPNVPYDAWRDVGMALHHETRGTGLSYWQTWSSRGVDYPGDEELEYKWQGFGHYSGPQVTGKTLVKLALDNGVAVGHAAPATVSEFDDLTVNADGTAKPSKYTVVTDEAFMARPAPRWIVKGVVPEGDLLVLFGESGAGKSFVALDLFGAVARGVAWRGCKTRQRRVCFIVAEGGGGFRNRLHAYRQHHGARPGVTVLHAAPNLMEKGDAKDVAKAIEAAHGADIVVVDTFAQTTPGANENAGEDVGKALANCRVIGKALGGALVVLVHHTGKDTTKGARGWSGLRAAADAEIEVSRTPSGRQIRTTKQKDGEDDQRWGFALEQVSVGLDEDDEIITSCVVVEAPLAEKVPKDARRKLGEREQLLFDAIQNEAKTGAVELSADNIVAAAVEEWAREGAKIDKNTPANFRKSLRRMCGSAVDYVFDEETGTVCL